LNNTSILIPATLVDLISNSITTNANFHGITDVSKSKLLTNCIELWLFILDKQEQYNYFVSIHSDDLIKFNIKIKNKKWTYKYILEILSNANLIEANEKYSAGSFPKSYRVLYNFTDDNSTIEIEINLSKVFSKIKDKQYWLERYTDYAHLIEDCYRTTIDINNWAKYLYANEGMVLKPRMKDGVLVQRILDKQRIVNYILRAVKVNINNLWFGVSPQGRFYSSITSLPSIITPFIRLSGKEVVSIDISNFHPLIISSFIKSKEFRNDVENGVFYKKLGMIMFGENTEAAIQKAKLEVMLRFFSLHQLKSGNFVDAMNFLYPNFIAQLNAIKATDKVAHITHTIESEIMVRGVGSLNINKLLKHDEVMVYKEHIPLVKQYLENNIFSRLGVRGKTG